MNYTTNISAKQLEWFSKFRIKKKGGGQCPNFGEDFDQPYVTTQRRQML